MTRLAPDRERLQASPPHLVDPEAVAVTATCKTCGETYTARRFVCPDPQGVAGAGCERMIQSWARSHPCFATTASQRRRVAA